MKTITKLSVASVLAVGLVFAGSSFAAVTKLPQLKAKSLDVDVGGTSAAVTIHPTSEMNGNTATAITLPNGGKTRTGTASCTFAAAGSSCTFTHDGKAGARTDFFQYRLTYNDANNVSRSVVGVVNVTINNIPAASK